MANLNPYDDAVVVSAIIANYYIRRILVGNGNSINVLFYDAFVRMNLSLERLRKVATPLVGFAGNSVGVEGDITLLVTIGIEP